MGFVISRKLKLHGCVIDFDRSVSIVGTETHELSYREVRLLQYLAGAAGRAVPKEEIEREVWQMSEGANSRAVSQAVLRLRAKVEADPRNPENLRTVHGVGWCLNHAVATGSREPTLTVERFPTAMNRFVGRAEEQRRIRQLLDSGARVVSLVGPGGSGKSRLATEVCNSLRRERYIVFCDLSDARTVEDIAAALRRATGSELRADDIGGQLLRILAIRDRAVVVFDNADQILPLLHGVIDACEGNHAPALLVTSRTAVGHLVEYQVVLRALAVPAFGATWDEAVESDAMQLMLDRAPTLFDHGHPTLDERHTAIRLVRALGGMPLTLELAADRIRLLGAQGVLQRLHDFPSLLRRSGNERENIWLIWEDEWNRLDPECRSALVRGSFFAGSLDLDAALLALFPGDSECALDDVQALVQRGWLRAATVRGRAHVEISLLVRHFLHRVVSPGTRLRQEAARAHASIFAKRWTRRVRMQLRTGDNSELRRRLVVSVPELKVAAERMAREDQHELAIPCGLAAVAGLKLTGSFGDGLTLTKVLLRLSTLTAEDRYELELERARLEYLAGRPRESMASSHRALLAAGELRSAEAVGAAQHQYSMSAALAGDHDTSVTVLTEGSDSEDAEPGPQTLRILITRALSGEVVAVRDRLAQVLRSPKGRTEPALEIAGWCVLGALSGRAVDRRQAVSCLTRLRPSFATHLDATDRTLALIAFAVTHAELGALEDAEVALQDAIRIQRERTSPPFLGLAASLYALLDVERGNTERASRWIQEAELLPCRESPATNEWMALARARLHLAAGETETGRCWLEEVLAQQPDTHSYARLRAHLHLTRLALDPAVADGHLRRALASAHAMGGGGFLGSVLATSAELSRRRGRTAEASAEATKAVNLTRRDSPGMDYLRALTVLATSQDDSGLFDDAAESFQHCDELAERLGIASEATLYVEGPGTGGAAGDDKPLVQ